MSLKSALLPSESGNAALQTEVPQPTRAANRTVISLAIFLGVSLLYVAISRGVFLYGDDILMFQVTESIVEPGDVAVTSPWHEGDIARAIPGRGGKGYSKYGVGQSLVAIPAYVASDLILVKLLPIHVFIDGYGNQRMGAIVYGTALTNTVIGGATVALVYLLAVACGFSRRTALVVAGLLAFGTLLAHYSATFLSEPLTGLALTGTVYGLVRSDSDGATGPTRYGYRWLAFSGFMAGLALGSRVATGLMLIAPGLWLLWLAWRWSQRSRRDAILALGVWGVPVVLWLIGIAWYNWVRFGSVSETGYGSEWQQMTTPFLTGLSGLLISPGKGLLWYNPPLLLALAGGIWFARRRRDLTLVIAGMLVGALLLYSRYYVWYGGGVWGTRFLVPMLPLLVLPAGEIVERAWHGRRAFAVATGVIAAVGLFVTALGIMVPFDRYVGEYNVTPEQHDAAIWEIADSPLVVHAERLDDTWRDPDIAADRYASKSLVAISLVTGFAGLGSLVLATRGVMRGRFPKAPG
ncbi:MAG TPA: phospholipid carrier-dependent glycosyltransferase [Thermomicrobiales bacterium]|nr:phospholipid carrier-dependent glycosyltransferase [Thermomicrobiales bacterium]